MAEITNSAIAKKLARITGLKNVFKVKSIGTGDAAHNEFYAELVAKLPISDNATVDKNSLMFVTATTSDFDGETGAHYIQVGPNNESMYVEAGDVFIWVQGMIVATSANYIESISASNADNATVSISVSDNGQGDITLSASHATIDNLSNVAEEGKYISKISFDSSGHVTSVEATDLSTVDTTYTLSGSESNGENTITLKSSKDTDTTNSGTFKIETAKLLSYKDGEATKTAQVSNDSIGEGTNDRIPTTKAVANAIKSAIAGGSKFQGVSTADDVLTLTAVENGDMWKLSADSQSKLGDKAANDSDKDLALKKGDVLIASVAETVSEGVTSKVIKWYLVPSGDEADTWRPINVDGEAALTNSDGTTVNLKSGDKISVSNNAGTITFEHKDGSVVGEEIDVPTGEGESTTTKKETVYRVQGETGTGGVLKDPIGRIILDKYGHVERVETVSLAQNVADSIKGLTFEAGKDTDKSENGAKITLGIETNSAIKDPETIVIKGDNGVKTTVVNKEIIISGTEYSSANTTVADESGLSDGKSGAVITTGLSGDTKTHTVRSLDKSIAVSANEAVVQIDYTGASTEDDWFILGETSSSN